MRSWFPLTLAALAISGCSSTIESTDITKVESKVPERSKYTIGSGGKLKPEHQAMVIKHADLSFKVFPESKSIAATTVLTIQAQQDLSQVVLDLDHLFNISEVKVNAQVLANTDHSNPQGQLSINLPEPVAKGDQLKVSIRYDGVPMEAKRAPWDGGFVWSQSKDGQPWIATAVQGEGCDVIWPCIDHPLREPESVDMHISVPEPLAAAANGKFMGKEQGEGWNTYHWKTLNQINTYAISLNIGPLTLLQDSYESIYGNSIDLQYWHLKGNEEPAKKLFTEFPQVLDFFEQVIGPYPFGDEKMGVVDTPHLGMEHQTINAYGNDYRVDKYGFDWLLHHEFAHEWFGNQLTHQDPDDMWLHEGLGSYMQPLYAQYLYGDLIYKQYLSDHRRRIANKAPVVSGRNMTEQEVYVDGPAMDIYNKGSVFLHTLREFIGDKAFFSAIRQLVYGTDTPKPGNFKPLFAGTQDFIDIVNKTTGADLTWLFKAYLYQKDLPKLVQQRTGSQIEFKWQLDGDLAFPMPLEVEVDGELKVLTMEEGKGALKVDRTTVVIVDPQAKILREQAFLDEYSAYNKQKREKQMKEYKKMKQKLAEYEKLAGE